MEVVQQEQLNQTNLPHQSKKAKSGNPLSFLMGPSRVYIVEFFVMHVALGSVLVSVINLFNEIIRYSEPAKDTTEFDSYFAVYLYEATIWLVASVLVMLPIFLVLYARTRKAERTTPAILQNKRRRIVIYISLALLFLSALGYFVSLVYTILHQLINGGALETEDSLWRSVIKAVFAIIVIKLAFFIVYRNTPRVDQGGQNG